MPIERIPITDRASWLRLRMQDLTASDIAAVAGVDPRRTPLKVFAEKTGMIPPADDSDILRRGRWLEAAVAEALRDERPTWDIRRAGVYLRDPAIRMGATPDAVAIDPERPGLGAVQFKVVARPVFEREWEEGRAPLKFQVQTLSEAMLIEADWAVVAALVVDTYSAELVVDEVPRHPAAEERIRETVRRFWSDVDAGRQPAPVYAADGEVIATLLAEDDGTEIDLTADNLLPALLDERAELSETKKAADRRLSEIKTELLFKLGAAAAARVADGRRITAKTVRRAAYAVEATSYRDVRVQRAAGRSRSTPEAFPNVDRF